METTRLGKTGLKVSRICLGTMTYGSPNWRDWVLGEEESRPFIKKALEAGVNFFDSADVYSLGRSEEIVGKALKDFASSRERVVIATKVCGVMSDDVNDRGLSRKHIMHSIDNSLRRLQTDYVDLYQIHRFDATTPIEETIEALHDVVKSGKARYIGASSMYAWQFSKYLHTQEKHGATKFVSMQDFYNLVYREEEREVLPLCRDQGIGVIPWSPLARGFLAGNRSRDGEAQTTRAKSDANILTPSAFREGDYEIRDRVDAMAKEKGVTSAQIALA
jgi:1-deoxyxylulose-5-phosphate synthase